MVDKQENKGIKSEAANRISKAIPKQSIVKT
jgi:hypothetical protein